MCQQLPVLYRMVMIIQKEIGPRSDSMKVAYQEEVDAMHTGLESLKLEMEVLYAARHEESSIVGPLKERFEGLLQRADAEINKYIGSVKTIRSAAVTHLQYIFFLLDNCHAFRMSDFMC